ncbi:MAG: response regulator, partial [Myxococcota bacterium]
MAKEVLVVDDNATIRSLSRKVLEGLNFNVTEAVDGQAGLERAQEASFHLILADINMPRMNGIDMIRHIRALPGYARVPVLIIST